MRGIVAGSATCSFIIGVAVAAVWSVDSGPQQGVSPGSIFDARFPKELDYLKRVDPAPNVAARRIRETFDLLLGGERELTLPMVQPSEYMSPYSLFGKAYRNNAVAGTAGSPAVTIVAPGAGEKRATQPTRAMFNDAQIASIKARLALDQDQEKHWPAVETALRDIAWRGAGSSAAELDPSSVQRLAIASASLIDGLHERQKRELRVFARLMGLDKLASQL